MPERSMRTDFYITDNENLLFCGSEILSTAWQTIMRRLKLSIQAGKSYSPLEFGNPRQVCVILFKNIRFVIKLSRIYFACRVYKSVRENKVRKSVRSVLSALSFRSFNQGRALMMKFSFLSAYVAGA